MVLIRFIVSLSKFQINIYIKKIWFKNLSPHFPPIVEQPINIYMKWHFMYIYCMYVYWNHFYLWTYTFVCLTPKALLTVCLKVFKICIKRMV